MLYQLDGIAPRVDATTWIAPNCHVIGNVRLAAHTSVWFGTTIRGDNEAIVIGKGSNIQENSVLHTDPGSAITIGENCTIGHKAMLHGCTIEDNCLIGMGATVLNGAVIGTNSLIGAGALITENTIIPPNSLVVGVPGKVIRELDAPAVDGIRASALHYQENAIRFRDGLREI